MANGVRLFMMCRNGPLRFSSLLALAAAFGWLFACQGSSSWENVNGRAKIAFLETEPELAALREELSGSIAG